MSLYYKSPLGVASGGGGSTFWDDPVIDQVDFTTAEPGSPSIGDRYINTVTGTSSGTSQSVTANYIYEWNGTSWTETVVAEGWTVWETSTNNTLRFNGSSWVIAGGTLVTSPVTYSLVGGITGAHTSMTGDRNTTYGNLAGDGMTSGVDNALFGAAAGDSLTIENGNTFLGSKVAENGVGCYDSVAVGTQALFRVNGGVRNTVVGYKAAQALTSANDVTINGHEAGYSLTTGSENTFVGGYSGYDITTGQFNTLVGYFAGANAGIDLDNAVGVGYKALQKAESDNHTCVGYLSGSEITTALNNSFFGYVSGAQTSTGGENFFAATLSGYGNVTGEKNVLLGYACGENMASDASNNVGIGHSVLKNVNTSSATAVGFESGMSNSAGFGNCYFGYQAGNLNTDSFNTFVGYKSGRLNVSGLSNTYVGYLSGEGCTGNNNTGIGYEAFQSPASSFNDCVAVGKRALKENGGDRNIAIGTAALQQNTNGIKCLAMGYTALYDNTTSDFNIALGDECADNTTTTTTKLLAIGVQCARNDQGVGNIYLGFGTAGLHTTGDGNIVVGTASYTSATSGASNTILGDGAGTSLVTASGCVLVGYNAGANETASNMLYIANSNTATPIIKGDFSTGALTFAGSITMSSGATITEFSTDGTFAANSDSLGSTQKAIKTYVDAHAGTGTPEKEKLTISTNGQTSFTLSQTPDTEDSFMLFLNGQLASVGALEDYTRSGTGITWVGTSLVTTDKLIAVYTY